MQNLEGIVRNLKSLALPIDNYYKIIQIDASSLEWQEYEYKSLIKIAQKKEEIVMYTNKEFIEIKSRKSSTKLEILRIINS